MSRPLFDSRSPFRLGVVTFGQLNRALGKVRQEIGKHGFWDDRIADVDVYLVPFGGAYGWQWYGSTGEICIPAVSLSRLQDIFHRAYTSLADVLRHEYGHALADTHRGLFRSREFTRVFGEAHSSDAVFEYDPEFHISAYAATNTKEDFAETFMCYLRHNGRLPARSQTIWIQQKWKFIERLGRAVSSGRRRWT